MGVTSEASLLLSSPPLEQTRRVKIKPGGVASITMVTLPKLSNSYACISLKTGTLVIGSLVIGSLNLVAFVIGIVASIGFMAAPTVGSAIIPSLILQLT